MFKNIRDQNGTKIEYRDTHNKIKHIFRHEHIVKI